MKERPILFSGAMVRAILEGRKSQTRRVIKPQPDCRVCEYGRTLTFKKRDGKPAGMSNANGTGPAIFCPYGQPGDRLWVREAIAGADDPAFKHLVIYRADSDRPDLTTSLRWRPSVHMPRWASRITLEIINTRVERVQEISEEDAKAEGIEDALAVSPPVTIVQDRVFSFKRLWDSINAERGYGWGKNPWVWVVEFGRV